MSGVVAPEVVETVARALAAETVVPVWLSRRVYGDDGGRYGLRLADARRLAAAAIAALPPSPAEEAVKLLDLLAEDTDDIPCRYDHHGACQEHGGGSEEPGVCSDRDAHELLKRLGIRTALASPAPAPQGEEGQRCLTCNGRVWSVRHGKWVARRETVGMVCQTCGTDYSR